MRTTSTDPGVYGADPSLREELRSRARALDLLALSAVPVVLLAVFALPETTRRSLAFAYHEPTALTAFSAHYVHLEAAHLLANVAAYGLLAGVGYLLAVAGGQRRFFFTAFATFCLAFPFVLSALNLAVPRRAIGFGFSGVNMAFAGLLPLLFAAFVHARLSNGERAPLSASAPVRLLPATFLVVVGWIGTLALPISTEPAGLVGPVVLLGGLLLGARGVLSTPLERRPSLRGGLARVVDRRGDGDLLAVGATLAVAYPVVGFPAEASVEGGVINLYVHLLGFCLAFIGPYALLAGGAFDDGPLHDEARADLRVD
ncbi:hypothetical protein SAMN04488066_103153 [Halorubrum aquaticum]|uniref:Rhomboid family protein n=1 Tax=Halorubrum aquaticum TaxID=387340 RepID=A0A1I2ZVP1_9EURY|nr:hypothetical protein [Halorubrum aquaticum]SFH41569.1 hypothetical protein SAMN04488066_103153 [Halorubrum aquaticum]